MESTGRDREGFYERLSVATLFAVGLYFLVVPTLLPGVLGWNALTERFGETTILSVVLGFQFLYIAGLTRDKHRLRKMTLETLEALNRFLFGADYKRHREAIDILIRGLRVPDGAARKKSVESLERLTGESFGEDADAWESWWTQNRSRFRLRKDVAVPGAASPGATTGESR